MTATPERRIVITVLILLMTLSFVITNGETRALAATRNFWLNQTTPEQGGLLKVTAPHDFKQGKVVFAGTSYSFKPEADKAVALLPVSYWLTPKEYQLSIVDSQGEISKTWLVTVQPGEFTSSYLTVDQENKKKISPTDPQRKKRRRREQKLVHQAREQSSSERFWQGAFQQPVEGTITTEFGATRYHNEKLANRHSGIDIAAKTGTPIKAANAGRVVLARDLLSTGKTVIIDHGWNVFSSYLHFSELKVKPGDKVKQGEIIGLMGETGFATGPHLHWTMTVGRTFVNPAEFLKLEL